ncbi:MAG TPA: glutathione S-transferase family protein [Lysobacter sp.]|nr:glutathione S-transferase family protein [Lysobacter sp.]
MPLLVIGNKNYSSWSLRPWLVMRHFGVAFDEKRLNLDTPEFFAEIERWSPTRTVPALHDDGLLIPDSLAICEYVNERWLDGRGWPSDLRRRAAARAAAAEMHSGFRPLRSQLPMNCRRKPDAYRWDEKAQADMDRVQAIWRQLRAEYGAGGEFLFGEFGIVDAMYAPVVMRFLGYGVPMNDIARRYADAITSLPAMREWLAAAEVEQERIAETDALAKA